MTKFNFDKIGGLNISTKTQHGIKYGIGTYIMYLAPSKSSGYQVCAMATKECILACLNTSGSAIRYKDMVLNARKNRTVAFYEQRENFMLKLINEINSAKRKAEKNNQIFTIRLNGTSDLSPEIFKHGGKNILELFPDIQIYDYTKIPNRVKLLEKYPNYDLTFSYTGYNWGECINMLNNNVRVAVIFDTTREKSLPKTFNGYKVIDGDLNDYRPSNEKNVIVGLRYKNVADKTTNKSIKDTPFVVNTNGLKHISILNNNSLAA